MLAPFAAQSLGARVGQTVSLTRTGGGDPVSVAVTGILADDLSPSQLRAVAPMALASTLGVPVNTAEVDIVLDSRASPERWLADHNQDFGPAAQLTDRGTILRPLRSGVERPLQAIIGTTLSAYLYTWQSNQEVEEEIAMGRTRLEERVGATEEELTEARVPYEIGHAFYRETARAHIMGDTEGMLKLIFHRETLQLLGVHIIGARAGELIPSA